MIYSFRTNISGTPLLRLHQQILSRICFMLKHSCNDLQFRNKSSGIRPKRFWVGYLPKCFELLPKCFELLKETMVSDPNGFGSDTFRNVSNYFRNVSNYSVTFCGLPSNSKLYQIIKLPQHYYACPVSKTFPHHQVLKKMLGPKAPACVGRRPT